MSESSCVAGLALALAMAASAAAAQAGTSFDGSWSVSIRSSVSRCESAGQYAIRVENGRVSFDGGGAIVSGQVNAHGYIRVSIRQHGGHGATGSGQLSGTRGGGIWRGQLSAILCSGRWEAQRM